MSYQCCEGVRGLKFSRRYFLKQGGVALVGALAALAATIYHSLGLPDTIAWYDDLNRPHHIYHGEPIAGLL